MTVSLGLDIGTNSIGSAWVDTEKHELKIAVSVFPSGVEISERKRGEPKNQKRRTARLQRRSIRRRAQRKRKLRSLLAQQGLLPPSTADYDHDHQKQTPWELRRDGLRRELTPHELGRVLIHLNQRRGVLGLDEDSKEEGVINDAIKRVREALSGRTFGKYMADLYDERNHPVAGKSTRYRTAVRNRRGRYEFYADRAMDDSR